jgi:uncharacterized protein (TIGR02646 family)
MGVGAVKKVLKGDEPPLLRSYRQMVPHGEWNQMRNDAHYGGQQAYKDCRIKSIGDQKGLCAYCEIAIHDNNPLRCRVEHFHPKSDTSTAHNWALDWQNMLGVCNGGGNPHQTAEGFHLDPTKANLSCDAHKDKMIQAHKLTEDCEGWILNPLRIATSPALFRLEKSTGYLLPGIVACAASPLYTGNRHASVEALVQHTIEMLNLNCDRLAKARLRIIWDIEQNKKKQRQSGFNAQQGLSNLAQRYFRSYWPGFFTTIRLCLSQAAEAHLHAISYAG